MSRPGVVGFEDLADDPNRRASAVRSARSTGSESPTLVPVVVEEARCATSTPGGARGTSDRLRARSPSSWPAREMPVNRLCLAGQPGDADLEVCLVDASQRFPAARRSAVVRLPVRRPRRSARPAPDAGPLAGPLLSKPETGPGIAIWTGSVAGGGTAPGRARGRERSSRPTAKVTAVDPSSSAASVRERP